MKNLIFLILSVIGIGYAQDTTRSASMTAYYVDSLTTTKDTIDFVFDAALKTDKFSVVATSTAVDTVEVYTQSLDGVRWVKQGVVDLATNTVIATIIGATTSKELQLLDPRPKKIRLVSLSNDGSICHVVVQTKRSEPIEGR